MKRRLLSILLVFSLFVAMSAIVFAEGASSNAADDGMATIEEIYLGSDTSKMRILTIADTHYICGTDQKVNNPYLELSTNTYGVEVEKKLQAMIDGILAEDYVEEVDCVLILGDIAYNDKPFQYFTKQYAKSIGVTNYYNWTDQQWSDWHDYMMENFYKSEYDTMYWLKERYLNQLSEAGIPYYLTTGNHDPYTNEMWKETFGVPAYDKDGNLVQDAHIYFTYKEDGSIFSADYLLKFPEHDTAIAMLDLYNYEEVDAKTHRGGTSLIEYLRYDCLYYTPIEGDATREANFMQMVEASKDFQNFYTCAHHYGGPLWDKSNPSDVQYIANNGNKYGNLRMMLYGHDHTPDTAASTTENGTVRRVCITAWSAVGLAAGFYHKDTGEKVRMWMNIQRLPWGYTMFESTANETLYYRISIDMTYYHDPIEKAHVVNKIDKTAENDMHSTPYELPFTAEYKRGNAIVLYKKTEE